MTSLALPGLLASGLIMLWGIALAGSLLPLSKRIPKTHLINRRAGIGLALLGWGAMVFFSVFWLDSLSTLWPRLGALFISVLSLSLGSRIARSALGQLKTYKNP